MNKFITYKMRSTALEKQSHSCFVQNCRKIPERCRSTINFEYFLNMKEITRCFPHIKNFTKFIFLNNGKNLKHVNFSFVNRI